MELIATIKAGDLTEIQKAFKTGEEANVEDENKGSSPLHIETTKPSPNTRIIEHLIFVGANVNRQDCFGWTPLHCICSNSRDPDIIQLLVSNGADVKALNKEGTAPIHYLVRKPLTTKKDLLLFEKALDILLENGVDINEPNRRMEAPVFTAIMGGNINTLQTLIQRNCDIHDVNRYPYSN